MENDSRCYYSTWRYRSLGDSGYLRYATVALMLALAAPLMAPVMAEAQSSVDAASDNAGATDGQGSLVQIVEDGLDTVRLETIRLTVSPAAPPVPALKYRFYYRSFEQRAGNRASYYRRSFDEITHTSAHLLKTLGDEFEAWAQDTSPPIEQLRKAATTVTDAVFPYLVRAAVSRDCDWGFGLDDLKGEEIFTFLLPEVEPMRSAARMLSVKSRLEIEEGRFDDAVETIRVAYQLSQDIADCDLLVNKLVGIAMAAVNHRQVAHFISTPDSPNLYWALASLDKPFIDVRPAIRFETESGFRLLPILKLANEDHTPSEWSRILGDSLVSVMTAFGETAQINEQTPDWQRQMLATALLATAYPEAKRKLIAEGADAAEVAAMPVGQVVMTQQARVYQFIADDMEKYAYAPAASINTFADTLPSERIGSKTPVGREYLPIGSALLPALTASHASMLRTQRDIAALQVIEAVRAHLSVNDNQLPQALDEVKVLPPPVNPVTSRPFVYRVNGTTAILELPTSDIPAVGYTRRYEITVR